MAKKNIFVLGLTHVQRHELETVRGAEDYAFHDLLDYERLVATAEIDFNELLSEPARNWRPSTGPSMR